MGKLRYQRRVKAAPAVAGIATPANSVLPVITGDVAGETSTTSDGTWSNAAAFKYQWYLDGVAIAGETSNSIDTSADWLDQTLSVVVSGCNGAGCVEATSLGVVLTEGSSYTGPLDLVPGAVVAYSSARALSAAMLGQTGYTLSNGGSTDTFEYDATTGIIPSAAIATFIGSPFDKTGALVTDATLVTLVNASGVYVGQGISGTGILADTVVTNIDAAPTIEISNAATATNPAATITFTPKGHATVINDNSSDVDLLDSRGFLWVANELAGYPAFSGSIGSTSMLSTEDFALPSAGMTLFMVCKGDAPNFSPTDGDATVDVTLGTTCELDMYEGANDVYSGFDASELDNETYYLFEAVISNAGAALLVNGVALDPVDPSTTGTVGALAGLNSFIQLSSVDELVVELLAYDGVMSAGNRTTLRNEIMTFYGLS